MNLFSQRWKKAISLWAFKRDNPDIKVIEKDGEYFYKGLLLQEKEGAFYYEKVLYKINLK